MDLVSVIPSAMSEREKQIYITAPYIWNLEKLYRRTYLQSINRDTDIENGCGHGGEKRVG